MAGAPEPVPVSFLGVGILLNHLIVVPLSYLFGVIIPQIAFLLFSVLFYVLTWLLYAFSILVTPILWPLKTMVYNPMLGGIAILYKVRLRSTDGYLNEFMLILSYSISATPNYFF